MGYEYEGLFPKSRSSQSVSMNTIQFEQLKSQLKLMTPQQLKSLQGEIRHSLEQEQTSLLTDEEIDVIASLFSWATCTFEYPNLSF